MSTDQQVRRLMSLIKKGLPLFTAAVKAGMSEPTACKYRRAGKLPSELKASHVWRTRPDPFSEVWPEIEALIECEGGGLEAKAVFEELPRACCTIGASRRRCSGLSTSTVWTGPGGRSSVAASSVAEPERRLLQPTGGLAFSGFTASTAYTQASRMRAFSEHARSRRVTSDCITMKYSLRVPRGSLYQVMS